MSAAAVGLLLWPVTKERSELRPRGLATSGATLEATCADGTLAACPLGALYLKLNPTATLDGLALFANNDRPADLSAQPTSAFVLQMAYDERSRLPTTETGLNDDQLRLLTISRLASGTTIAVNGGTPTVYQLGWIWDLSAPGIPITIGGNFATDMQALDGDLFELIVLTGTTAVESEPFVHCLLAKYGLDN